MLADTKKFLQDKHPGDTATALSLDAFVDYAIDGDPENAYHSLRFLGFSTKDCRIWCTVICSLCQAMFIVYEQNKSLTPQELYFAATTLIDKVHGFYGRIDELQEEPLNIDW